MCLVASLLFFAFLFRPLHLLTEQDQSTATARWWDQNYSIARYICGVEPVAFLKEHIGRLWPFHRQTGSSDRSHLNEPVPYI